MRTHPMRTFPLLSGVLMLSSLSAWASPTLASTPEQEMARISRGLKPISDSVWKEIAGQRIEEKYQIVPGDTLYTISKRLFDDAKYWPKIWSVNNAQIRNPHFIRPGMILAFQGGNSDTLPSLGAVSSSSSQTRSDFASGVQGTPSSAEAHDPEWKRLPKQPWEISVGDFGPLVDREGLDKDKARVAGKIAGGIELEAFASSEKVPLLGQITGARSESTGMSLGDTLYIEAEERLEIGETYSVTQEPAILKARKSDRSGYSYSILGQVKILGLKDGLYLGKVTQAKGTIRRGHDLIKRIDKLTLPRMIAADRPLQGVLMFDRNFATFAAAQNKIVFVDRGTRDGVNKGMVFRAYQYFDPSDDHEVTESDFIIDADILVIDSTEDFSTGIVLGSFSTILENSTVVLLTDISDVKKRAQFRARTPEEMQRDQELDELESLPPEDDDALSDAEKKEIERLEQWKKNPDGANPEDLPPAPTEGEVPPADETPPLDEPSLEPPPEETLPPSEDAPPLSEDLPPPSEEPSPSDLPDPISSEAPPSEDIPPPEESALPPDETPASEEPVPTEEPPALE